MTQRTIMNDWLHNLPIVWMALLVLGLTALVTAAIYVVVMVLSVGERARSFKAVSPGLLPPLGILFALSEVNWVKWLCLGLQAVCALLAIAMVHSDNRLAAAITMGLFGVGVAASLLLILAHDRPFTGELAVSPNPLLQVMPALKP
jgi:uncharacterized MnhB-related membrane protein